MPHQPDNQPSGDAAILPTSSLKSRSAKQFLLSGVTVAAIGIGAIGLLGVGIWLARKQVATTTIEGFLRSQGVETDIAIEKLQFNTAQISDLRIGPANRPTLTAQRAIIRFHYDSRSRLFVVDSLHIDGAKLALAVNTAGQIDFGALKPLMKPGTGPKRSIINGVRLSDASVILATPHGPAYARLSVWGGEPDGWTGRADVTPPKTYLLDAQNFVPIRAGFAARQLTNAAGTPMMAVGFSLNPAGQSLTYGDMKVGSLSGNILGKVDVGPRGALRVDTRRSTLQAGALSGAGLSAGPSQIQVAPLVWQQGQSWQTTGWGSGAFDGTLTNLTVSDARIAAQSVRFLVRAARTETGRMQLDFQTQADGVSGQIGIGRGQIIGSVSASARDLSKLMESEFQGRSAITLSDAAIPDGLRRQLKTAAPRAIGNLLNDTFSAQTALSFGYKRGAGEVALAGPLLVNASSGARASWTRDTGPAPALLVTAVRDKPIQFEIVGSGKIDVTLPDTGAFQAIVDGATARSSGGWAVVGRSASLRSFGQSQGRAVFRSFQISAPKDGSPRGQASGQVAFGAPGGSDRFGRANLSVDLTSQADKVSAQLVGPISGFGTLFGSPSGGIGQGRINLNAQANRLGQAWQFGSIGRFAANSVATNDISMSGVTLDLTASGRLNLTPGAPPSIMAQVKLDGGATGARQRSGTRADTPTGMAARNFGGVRLQTQARANGNLNRLAVNGTLKGQAIRGAISGFAIDNAAIDIGFGGILSGGGVQLTSATTARFGRVRQTTGATSGRIDVGGLNMSGPVTITKGNPQSNASQRFWSGFLLQSSPQIATKLASDLRVTAQSLALGATRLVDVTISGPLLAQAQTRGGANSLRASSNIMFGARSLVAGDTILRGLSARGKIGLDGTGNGVLAVTSDACVNFGAQSGSFPGEARVNNVRGKLCPDGAGQLARFRDSNLRITATTSLDPLSIQMGDQDTGQSMDIGEVSGLFTTKPGEGINLALLATQFGFNLRMPDGSTALIKANEAALDILPKAGGISLTGRIGQVSSIGLPVLLSGGATADFVVGTGGLNGSFDFNDIIVRDTEKLARFGEVRLAGRGVLAGNQVSIDSQVFEPVSNIKLAQLNLGHNIADGSGRLDVDANDLLFSPTPVGERPGLEIAALLPPLRGVMTDMVGVANASADFEWARNQPIRSSANVNTKGVDFGILLGTVSAFSGDISFDDVLTARTAGNQTIKVGLLNTGGIPIENGVVQFSLPGTNSLRLEDASWPFADGKLSVRPATWQFRDADQSFAIDVEDVDLARLLRLTDVPNLEIDGRVSGVFPIEVREGNVEIVGGRLKAREGGGIIRYTGPNPSPPPPPPNMTTRVRERLFGKAPPTGANLAFEALRALEYKILEITVDGRITGELKLGVILEGANQQVLSGVPFKFNINMNVPIGQLLDNMARLNNAGTSPEVLTEIDRVMREDATARATPSPQTATPPTPPAPRSR